MRAFAVGAGLAVLVIIPHAASTTRAGAFTQGGTKVERAPRLFKDSRQSLAIARAQGRRDITLVVAAVAGRSAALAQDAARLGGDVRFRDDSVGYLRVRLPLDSATAFSELPNVEAAAVDYEDSYPNRLSPSSPDGAGNGPSDSDPGMLQARPQSTEAWPPRPGDGPLRDQYSPLKDIGAAEFLAKNPTFDGRGVTIALLDGNVDLLLPEFQTAYTADGRRVAKIADFVNVTDPRDDAELNPQWVDMRAEVDAPNGRATFSGKTFTVPRPGHYRLGFFDERRFNDPANAAYIEQDVDRDGNPKGDDGLFGVLWDERTNDVWVDTNRDLSFADQKAMTDYVKRQDVGAFGKDDPATPIRESIGFAVQTDRANKFISLNLGIYQHASGIMGHVVGNREPNGRISGVAPGARLVSMFYGVSNLHGAIEGIIRAFRDPQIDLIVFEQSVAMASIPYLLADGRHPLSIVAQRLTTRYPKLMFVPGGNSSGFGIVAEDGVAPGVVSVGGYQSRDSYLANWGIAVEEYDNLHWGGMSHGPSGTGALKPDLLAPSGQVSTDVGYRKGQARKGLYQLPPGYSVDGGTSTATPMAAGATALVVSAARQRGVRYDARSLKAALQGGARRIPHLGAHEQGAGVIQVANAFDLLQKLQSTPLVSITSRAPVRTALSTLLDPPNEGPGLLEREGWKPGDRGERTIVLTRTSGPDAPMPLTIEWLGNDGTFSSTSSVSLPLNRAVPVAVAIAVKNPGVHSAQMVLTSPELPVPAHRVLATVVAAIPLAANGYSATTTVSVARPADRGVFVVVPPNAAALALNTTSKDGPLRLSLVSPEREQLYPCGFPPTSAPCAIARPTPGVWEINVANNDMTYDEAIVEAAKPRSVTVNASAVAVDLSGGPAGGWTEGAGAVNFAANLTNRLAAVKSVVPAGSVASAFRTSRSIARGEQHVYQIAVPKGAAYVRARVHAAQPNADLDLYLLDCTGLDRKPAAPYERDNGGKSPPMPDVACATKAKAAGVGPDGEVEVSDPAPGKWIVVVDGYSLSGSSSYEYVDMVSDPSLGAVAVAAVAEDRAAGSSWSAPAHAWVAKMPAGPRTLAGRVVVTSREVMQTPGFGQSPRAVPLGSLDIFDGTITPTRSSSRGNNHER